MTSPNVFFLVIDSLRADAVFGDHVPTPHFDELSSRGSVFHQCICSTTTTTPSFSSMLTACYPPRHGVRGLQGYRLSSALTTLGEAFGARGYHTYAEVTGPLVPETGVLRGFSQARHRQAYRVPFFNWRDEIVSRMQDYASPWLMLLHIWEVHRPYRAPPDFEKRNNRRGYEAAVAATDEWLEPVFKAVGDNTIVVITGDHGEEYAESALEYQLLRLSRRGRRSLHLRRWLPPVDEKLARMEIGHGFALYEHLIRVPLIFAGPGIPRTVVADQVRHVDLFPTLADLCGVEAPTGVDGRSLRPLIEGRLLREEPAYIEAVGVKLEGKRITGARTPDWKLLKHGDTSASLYKLNGGASPDEKRNLYKRYPEVAARLEAWLEEVWAAQTAADSGMTSEEEEVVEAHLRDLGYL